YHISGLSFGGTEKFLQIVAKFLNKEKYEVFFMYSSKKRNNSTNENDGRIEYLKEKGVNLIDFEFDSFEKKYPYYFKNMTPNITDVINDNNIDLLVTATDGHTEFPINMIRDIPIVLINIFGAPNLQKNIIKNVCISKEVASKIRGIVPQKKIGVIYIPSEEPAKEALELGKKLRNDFNIKETDLVFGRIGRADDTIFDPIGINAFKLTVMKYPNSHYIIMSPPPILVELVNKERIHNVHFLPPSSRELDIWTFHNAIDVLAHFRKDGESCGLNIAESMLCSKPIISHKSMIWNAHLEYLASDFSRIADVDNIDQYAGYMEEMLNLKKCSKLELMGAKAKDVAQGLFLINNSIHKFENIIDSAFLK
ncbi:MAG: hypothetical protein Q7R78_03215, partial [bacterium]|nr:hypothetical protein [bacterium]